jgi:hypothetical protein
MPGRAIRRGRGVQTIDRRLLVILSMFAVTGAGLVCLIVFGLIILIASPTQPTAVLPPATIPGTPTATPMPTGTPAVDYSRLVNLPPRASLNQGLTFATPDYVRSLLGIPGEMSDSCLAVTNPKLQALLVTQEVGPTTVSGLKPAVEALQRIYAAVKRDKPDLYEQLAGQEIPLKDEAMLCVRRVAGLFPRNYSLHAWGIAVDVAINRTLDIVGDRKVQLGLLQLYPYFHAEGFYWGAAFLPNEDAMHFEVSRQLLDRWKSQGLLDR